MLCCFGASRQPQLLLVSAVVGLQMLAVFRAAAGAQLLAGASAAVEPSCRSFSCCCLQRCWLLVPLLELQAAGARCCWSSVAAGASAAWSFSCCWLRCRGFSRWFPPLRRFSCRCWLSRCRLVPLLRAQPLLASQPPLEPRAGSRAVAGSPVFSAVAGFLAKLRELSCCCSAAAGALPLLLQPC